MGDDELLKFVESLFTSGFGDKAARLMLVDANNKDLGGWGREAIIQRIRDYTRIPTAEVENLRAKANLLNSEIVHGRLNEKNCWVDFCNLITDIRDAG